MTFLLVRLDDGLHPARVTGLALNVQTLPGVSYVCDLGAVSRETLDHLLLQPAPPVERAESLQQGVLV